MYFVRSIRGWCVRFRNALSALGIELAVRKPGSSADRELRHKHLHGDDVVRTGDHTDADADELCGQQILSMAAAAQPCYNRGGAKGAHLSIVETTQCRLAIKILAATLPADASTLQSIADPATVSRLVIEVTMAQHVCRMSSRDIRDVRVPAKRRSPLAPARRIGVCDDGGFDLWPRDNLVGQTGGGQQRP